MARFLPQAAALPIPRPMRKWAFRAGQLLALVSSLGLAAYWVWRAHTATPDGAPTMEDDTLASTSGTAVTLRAVESNSAQPVRPEVKSKRESDREKIHAAGLLGALGGGAPGVFGPGGLGGGNKSALGW